MKIALLVFMFFAHIVDDYYLQGWLASAKQKEWWEKNNPNKPNKLYRFDYLMALFCHSLSWSIMITIPLIIHSNFDLQWFWFSIPINLTIHFVVDDLKANKHIINLIIDQSIHFLQILVTWIIYTLIF